MLILISAAPNQIEAAIIGVSTSPGVQGAFR
jgi:hypothetical protein